MALGVKTYNGKIQTPRKLPPHCKMVINEDTHMLRHFRIKHIAHLGLFSTRREWAEAVNQEDIKGLEEGNSYMYAKHVIHLCTCMHVYTYHNLRKRKAS